MATALAIALGRPGLLTDEQHRDAEAWLTLTQDVLKNYRSPKAAGGWSLFPFQDDPEQADTYATVLAAGALLETRKASLPWDGGAEERDLLLAAAVRWLIEHFDATDDPRGWGVHDALDGVNDGLTLQVYAILLRAEVEAGNRSRTRYWRRSRGN
jgi:hypothetical protein